MNYHFNWDKLLEGRDVEEFLAADDLWGRHQDADNPGRKLWRKYLHDRLQNTPRVRLLEVGFGSGIDYRGLEASGLLNMPELEYYGVDVTRKFVEHAQQNYRKMKPFLIDGYHLPFGDTAFDVVYLRHILEHQTHYRYLLSEIFRVCQDEVFITFFIPLTDSETDDIRFDGSWHNNHYSRKMFCAFAREHGFEPKELGSFHYSSGYSDDLLVVCKRVAPVTRPVAGTIRPTAANRPLKIAFASQHYPAPGQPTEGIGAYVVTVAHGLARRGHQVHIVTCLRPGQPADWVEGSVTVHQIHLPGPNAKDPNSVRTYSEAVAARLKVLDAEHRLDVVEFQEWAAEGWAYHPRSDQLMVVRTQTPSWVVREFEYADGTSAELRIDEMERWPLERADLITTPSRLAARRLAEHWVVDPTTATIIPNAVDSEQFLPPAPRPAPAQPLVLCANRYTPLKGAEQFVRAAAIVHRQFPAARFRMVGRNGDWNGQPADRYLRGLALSLGLPEDRLELPGPCPREALIAEYAVAEICVNPSLYENVSHVTLEALSCGRPTILTSGQGNAEYMTDGEDCLIVPPGDVEKLAQAMSKLLPDEALRERMGAAARRTVERKLSTAAVAKSLEATYRGGLEMIATRPVVKPAQLNIAILTHNALDYTQKCLASIARHTPIPHNIFIVDNASTDGTPDWLRTQVAPHCHVWCSEKNLGVAGGRNHLIRTILPHLTDDGFIVFLDNDVEVLPGWYESFLKLSVSQSEIGIAGAAGHPFIVKAESRQLLPGPETEPAPVDVVSGFCFWVKGETVRAVGLFDEKLGGFWHEDDDYCVRAISLGYEIFAVPGAPIVHHGHKSGTALPDIEHDGSPENQSYLVNKWRRLGYVDEAGRIIHPHRASSVNREPQPAWPPEVVALLQQAEAAFGAGVLQSAGAALRMALDLVPDDPQIIVALGNVLVRLGEVESAEREFVKATVLRPNFGPAHSNLAAVSLHLGRAPEAAASARRALALDPNDAQANEVLTHLMAPIRATGQDTPKVASSQRQHASARQTTIGVDARTLCYPTSSTRGIGQYTFYHLSALMAHAPGWQFVLYLDDPSLAESIDSLHRLLEYPNVHVQSTLTANPAEIDLFHIPDSLSLLGGFDSPFRLLSGVPVSVVCYDLIPLIFRDEYFDKWEAGVQAAYTNRLEQIKRSEGSLLAISENTRRDFHRHLGIPLERMIPIMAGLNQSALSQAGTGDVKATLRKHGLKRPFFLTVGSLEPRKGFETTLHALVAARSSLSAQVAVVGGLDDPWKAAFRRLIEANRVEGVVFTGFIPREELEDLYSAATALVFPSRYEGFGFPVLEAMARGCPVITCNNSSLPEVAGEGAVVVPTDNVQQVAAAMIALARGSNLRNQLIERGYAQAAKFSWDDVAGKTIKAIQGTLHERGGGCNAPHIGTLTQPTILTGKPLASPSIRWAANLFDFSGYSWLSRQTLPALAKQGATIQIQPLARDETFIHQLQQDPHAVNFWNQLLTQRVESGLYVFFHPPASWEGDSFFDHFREHAPGFDAYVGLTMWETDRLPGGWAETCNRMDEVWVPSTFNRETFAAAGVDPERIRVIPFGLDTTAYDPARVRPMQLAGRRGFNFLSIFQWNKRKGWDILIKAYLSAFTQTDDVCLFLRTYPDRIKTPHIRHRIDGYIRQLGYDPRRIPPIELLDDFIPEDQMPTLFAAVDAFVLPTRGEGWGIPYAEAMAMAKPVIGTRWSGHLDFMNDDNSYLIDIEGLAPVDPEQTQENPFYTPDQLWAQPSLEHTISLMRHVYEQRDEARAVGARARQTIQASWSPERTAKWIIEQTNHLTRTKPAARPLSTPQPVTPPSTVGDKPKTLPVVWHAPVFDPSGYADDARSLALGIDRLGATVRLDPITKLSPAFVSALDPATRAELERLARGNIGEGYTNLIHAPGYAFQRDPKALHNIGRTMFETDRLPPEWVTACNQMDEIWVPTEFNRGTFAAAGVTVPLIKIPMGVDAVRFNPSIPPYPSIAALDGYKFLSVFEWSYRKGWDVLLKAWAEAFKPGDHVYLILRTNPLGQADSPDALQRILGYITDYYVSLGLGLKDVAPIHIVAQPMYHELPSLYAAADAFVLPSRGEGWGRPYIEAMAMAKPVIGTRWSGNLEFMSDDNSCLLEIDGLAEVDEHEEIPFYRGHQWAEPSAKHLVQLLGALYNDPASARSIGERARRDVSENWNWDNAARIVLRRLEEVGAAPAPRHARRSALPVAVHWEGAQFAHHSMALVNRELSIQLAQRNELDLSLIPYEPPEFGPEADPRFKAITEHLNKPLAPADVHVRHHWPPNFTPPPEGHWVMIQPWEFGSLPKLWLDEMAGRVDEIWAYTNFVRDCYIASGLPADRVHVVPLGIDPQTFRPDISPLSLNTTKRFKFLFVGGTIWRKGIDVLLDAYKRAFSAGDDVCLVIKDACGKTFYQGQTAEAKIAQFHADPSAPEILYLADDLPPADLPRLYTACDCLAHPYRGEGFGLPIAEAMACGLPVIVTNGGACLDFCDESVAYLIPAQRMCLPQNRIGHWETVGTPFVYEPDGEALTRWMRFVFENPVEAKVKGVRAGQHIHKNFNWQRAADAAIERLEALKAKPIARFSQKQETKPRPQPPGLYAIVAAQAGNVSALWHSLKRNTAQPLVVTTNLPQEQLNSIEAEVSNASLVQLLNRALGSPGDDPVFLLSSDIVLTPDWLESLRGAFERDLNLGIVGPVSNRAPAPQRLKVKYDGTGKALRQFARQNARKHAGELKETPYLGGFCLVFNRRACREVGALREEVGLAAALWDYYARLRQAGIKLAVALDVYIHHEAFSPDEGAEFDELAAIEVKVQQTFTHGSEAAQAGDWDKAVNIFKELLVEYPDLAGGHAALGTTFLAKGDYGSASHSLQRAVELAPHEVGLRNQLGVALFQSGEAGKAEGVFCETLEVSPDNVDAMLNLVELYRLQSRYPESAESIKRALGLAPENPEVLAAFGRLGLELGDTEAAQTSLNHLERVAPDHPAVQMLKEAIVPT